MYERVYNIRARTLLEYDPVHVMYYYYIYIYSSLVCVLTRVVRARSMHILYHYSLVVSGV